MPRTSKKQPPKHSVTPAVDAPPAERVVNENRVSPQPDLSRCDDRLLTLTELARKWGWSNSKLYRIALADGIPHVRIGAKRMLHFRELQVEAWLRARSVGAADVAEPSSAPRRSRKTIEEEYREFDIDPEEAMFR